METNKYSRGKIYKLVPKFWEGDEFLTYYGSTCEIYLSRRLQKHILNYKVFLNGKSKSNLTSFRLFETYGIDNIEIILVEDFECESKNQLEARERYYIENNDCINKKIPTRAQNEYMKIYRDNNKDKILNYQKIYNDNNKEKIKERKGKKITCECGSIYRKSDKSRHENTNKHVEFINN